MRIAIMQPYFFPYVGYFELIDSVDVFYFYDDAQYIRRGWVNRNRIRSNSNWQWITVPVEHAPQTEIIKNIKVKGPWIDKINNKLLHTYGKNDINLFENYIYLNDVLQNSIKKTCEFLNIKTEFKKSSDFNIKTKGQQKILDLCKTVGATTYINPTRGKDLYDDNLFKINGVNLRFMPPTKFENKLSILDLILGDKIRGIK